VLGMEVGIALDPRHRTGRGRTDENAHAPTPTYLHRQTRVLGPLESVLQHHGEHAAFLASVRHEVNGPEHLTRRSRGLAWLGCSPLEPLWRFWCGSGPREETDPNAGFALDLSASAGTGSRRAPLDPSRAT
jgi:hypothetical protein